MSHVRAQLRAAAVTLLEGCASLGAGRVHAARRLPLQPRDGDYPAACVYTAAEAEQSELLQVDYDVPGGRVLSRALPLVVELWLRADNDDPDGPADALAAEVEAAFGADPTFGGLAKESHLVSSQVSWDRAGTRPPALVQLVWMATYWTAEADPETAV